MPCVIYNQTHMIFDQDIIEYAKQNTDFRRVLKTGKNSQLVLMAIPPGGEIGGEVHDDTDQILVFVSGEGEAVVGEETKDIGPNHLTFVPAGSFHNFKNTGTEPLRLFTIYAPPEHADGTVHHTKEDADRAHH